jgi:hypothetical protein
LGGGRGRKRYMKYIYINGKRNLLSAVAGDRVEELQVIT